MFSLTTGIPIARSDNPQGKKIILSIVDPDTIKKDKYSSKRSKPKKIAKKTKGGCNKKSCSNKKSVKGCGQCCKFCDDEECYDTPCCNNCHIYYSDYSESDTSVESSQSDIESEESDSESIEENTKGGIIGDKFNSPTNTKLVPLPNLTDRFVDYVAGPSGSGKSTITSILAHEFKRIYPNKPIYIFSRTDSRKDPAYSNLKPTQILIDETLIDDPMDITEEINEGGALIIFDDCNTIPNEKLRKEVEKLMSDAMEVGRKLGCNMIITSHLVIPNEKKLGRTILNEMHNLTVFPKSGSAQQIRYALKTYFGLNNKQIDKILELKSRWVRISKTYPQYVLHDKGAYIL